MQYRDFVYIVLLQITSSPYKELYLFMNPITLWGGVFP